MAVNGVSVKAVPDAQGLISIPIPGQHSQVDMWFEEPFSVRLSAYLSLVVWLGILAFIFLIRVRRSVVD
jgi:hypothetical protein